MSIDMAKPKIYAQISKTMGEIGSVGKDSKNVQQGYAFRGIDALYLAAHPAMVKNGIFCAPKVLTRDVYRFEKTNDRGGVTTWCHVALQVEHVFYADDGSSVSVITCGEGLDNSDKATNKAMSGAMKYALIELFCVPTSDMEDSDRSSPEAGTSKPRAERTSEPTPLNKPKPAPPAEGDHIQPPEDLLITVEQAQKLHVRFREALPESMQKQADGFLHDFLARNLILDKDGNPSAKAIRKSEFATVGKQAIAFAEVLK